VGGAVTNGLGASSRVAEGRNGLYLYVGFLISGAERLGYARDVEAFT